MSDNKLQILGESGIYALKKDLNTASIAAALTSPAELSSISSEMLGNLTDALNGSAKFLKEKHEKLEEKLLQELGDKKLSYQTYAEVVHAVANIAAEKNGARVLPETTLQIASVSPREIDLQVGKTRSYQEIVDDAKHKLVKEIRSEKPDVSGIIQATMNCAFEDFKSRYLQQEEGIGR